MLSGAKVLRVLVREGRAIGVELVNRKQRLELFAGKVVLAGGGIGSARLLHASGLAKGAEPFFSDPVVAVMGSVDGKDGVEGGAEVPMAAGHAPTSARHHAGRHDTA